MTKIKRIILPESELPSQWYNILSEMPQRPKPLLHPATRQPITAEDLSPLFAEECARQELNITDTCLSAPER